MLLSLISVGAYAQQANLDNSTKPKAVATEKPQDGYFKKDNILSAKVTPYANLREADVMFQKRVWREIDLREKMNSVYASPKSRLIDIIISAVMAGELTAYDAASTKDDPGGDGPGRRQLSEVRWCGRQRAHALRRRRR